MDPADEVTQLLERWRLGDQAAFDRLTPSIYQHLHEVAGSYMRRERAGHTLQATALVHEVFIRLMNNRGVRYSSRRHFFTFAAKLMRRILVDHSRRAAAGKRFNGGERIELAPELAWVDAGSAELLDLDAAMDELSALAPEKVETLELRFFLGATSVETAELQDRSRASVDREVDFAISWLHRRLKPGVAPAVRKGSG